MRVLVACEKSGVVRDAFKALGVEAYSADILPTEKPGKHCQVNAVELLNGKWDLLIAHPPCRYLSFAGNRWRDDPGRKSAAENAMLFFRRFTEAPIKHICVENPCGLPGKLYRKPDQIIHPYYFGDPFMKRTCLWLKNLPQLNHFEHPTFWDKQTHTAKPRPFYYRRADGKAIHFTESVHTAAERSKTFPGIARAMAEQWTEWILSSV